MRMERKYIYSIDLVFSRFTEFVCKYQTSDTISIAICKIVRYSFFVQFNFPNKFVWGLGFALEFYKYSTIYIILKKIEFEMESTNFNDNL